MAKSNLRRIEKFLGLIIIILLIVFAVIVWQTWRTQAPPRPTPSVAQQLVANNPIATSVWFGQTVKEAHQFATQQARAWTEDAQLITTSATYPPGTDLRTGTATWTFTYFSPAKNSTALISVADTHTSIVSEKKYEGTAPVTINNDSWTTDSPQIMQTILEKGGDDFITENPETTVVLTLATNPSPYWEAVFFAHENGEVFNIKLDAMSGEQLP